MNRFAVRVAALLGLLTAEVVGGLLLFLTTFAGFFYLARVVFIRHSMAVDDWGWHIVGGWKRQWPELDSPMQLITFFASLPFLLPASLVSMALLWWRKHRREAWEIGLATAGGSLLNQLLKMAFHRSRPVDALVHTYGLSFPSGHSMIGMAFYGCWAWLLARHFGRPGWALPLLLWSVLIGITRVYLHAHYTTDVLAGLAGGLAWLVLLRAGIAFFWKEEQELLPELNQS